MKKLQRILLALSALFAAAMLFFTFFTLAWHSDAKGFEQGWQIQIRFKSGTLATVADCIWTAAPFLLLLSTVFFFFGEGAKRVGTLFSCLPLSLYSLLRFPELLKEDAHGTMAFTTLGILLVGVFCIASAFIPDAKKIAPAIAFSYMGIEILLLILSFVYGEKYSYFYFQKDSFVFNRIFRYRFFVISIFLYYVFYALSLGLRMIPLGEKEAPVPLAAQPSLEPQTKKDGEENEDEEAEEDYSSLSLEDLGIER